MSKQEIKSGQQPSNKTPLDIQATRNLHEWLRTVYIGNMPPAVIKTREAIFEHFKALLEDRLKDLDQSSEYPNLLRKTKPGFVKRQKNLERLTYGTARTLIKVFKDEGLSMELLNSEPISRSMFVVLMNVQFVRPYTMKQFLRNTFDAWPFIETACSVYGNHDCIFTIWSSHDELQEWLWEILRHNVRVKDIRTLTYQTYSDVYHRFDVSIHPDHPHVIRRRWEYSSEECSGPQKLGSDTDAVLSYAAIPSLRWV